MKSFTLRLIAIAASIVATTAQAAGPGEVQITPLGSHHGEFCLFDRALILEDPDGTRLLYDPGRTVAGPEDSRLGDIDVILVSHMHGDHVGDTRLPEENAGTCANPDVSVKTFTFTGAVEIAVEKGALIVTGSEMPFFFAPRLAAAGGEAEQSVLVRFGASYKVGGVSITTVPAAHSNGINAGFFEAEDPDYAEQLQRNGLTAYAGPPTGYVLTFSNGLVVYLSGDTGITAEQKAVVRDHYGAKLVVINIGDTFTTGPKEAAFVVNTLIKPKSVIASHANEEATQGGLVLPGTKTETFIEATRMPVHVPLSGITMAFDDKGKCVWGC